MNIATIPTEQVWGLHGVRLFDGMTPQEVLTLQEAMPIVRYRQGEYLFFAGEAADSLFLLQEGLVKVSYITLNGDEKILNIFQPGDVFGELFLGKYRHRVGEARAMEDVAVCKLCEETFLDLIHEVPRIALNFIRHLADEQRETLARMHALMRSEAKYRLLGVLLHSARRYCCTDNEWFTLPASITQEDIANMTALNRSTVSSLINDLRREGVLGGTGRSLTVHRAAIQAMLEEAGLEILV
ncbi:MAG: Crp/Fnr family transcriptional regulator [Chloroflexi bacterium]|nr:Crp/Fnr family transcriptional regulator [Chloroflexota bacterium]